MLASYNDKVDSTGSERLTLEAADGASPTIAPGDNTDAITVTANNVAIDGLGTEIGVTSGEATAIDLSGLSSADSVTIENTSFDADGAEGETYVFDPNGAVDLDAVEDANSFAGPAPVTGEVAINPNQPGAYNFNDDDGGTITRGGAAVEQPDGTLVVLPEGKDRTDNSLNLFDEDATLLYVSNDTGSQTAIAATFPQRGGPDANYLYELDGKGDTLSTDEFDDALGPRNPPRPETGTNYQVEDYDILEGDLVINWITEEGEPVNP